MDVSGATTIKTLGVRIGLDGVASSVADLDKVGAAGEQTASRVAAAGRQGATSFSQAFVAEAGKAATAAKEYATTFENQFVAEQGRIKEGIARGFLTPAEAKKAGQDAALAYNQGLLGQLDQLGAKGLNATNSSTYIDLSNSLKTIETTSIGAGAGLGRVRQGLISLIAQATGTIPVLDRVGGSLSTMAFGGGVTLAVVAGIAAIAGAYEFLTEDSRKAKEEQDKLTQSLHDWYQEQQAGAAGKLAAEIDATIAKVRALRGELAHADATGNAPFLVQLKAQFAGLLAGGDPFAQATAMVTYLGKWYADQAAAANQGSDEVAAAIKAANDKVTSAIKDAQSKEISALAGALQSGTGTGAQTSLAWSLIQDYQRQVAALDKTAPSAASGDAFRDYLQRRNDLVEKSTTLVHALVAGQFAVFESKWSDNEAIFSVATDAMLASLVKQGDAMRATSAEYGKQYQASLDAARLVGVEGVAHEYLANTIKAEGEVRDALKTKTGDALRTALDDIAATQQQNHENIAHAAAIKDAADAQKAFNDLMHGAQAIADANIAKTHTQTDAYAKLSSEISSDLLKAVEQFTRGGSISFASFFRAAETGSAHLVEQIRSDLAEMASHEAEAIKKHETAQAEKYAKDIQDYQKYLKVAQVASAALAGGSLGYSVGQQTGNATTGALIGGIGGATIGGETGGFWGAVAGGLAGVAGALLGAADAHRKAAAELQKAAEAMRANLAQANIQAGTETPLQGSIDQAKAQFDALFDSVDASLPGLKNQAEREQKLAQVRADEAIIIEKLIAADAEQQKQTQLALDARQAYAEGLTAEGQALQRQAQEEKELFDATQAHYTDAQIAQLKYIQGLEDEAAAKAKAIAAQRQAEDYQVRGLAASGQSTAAEQQRFALDQKRELEDAIKSGMDPATLAILQNTLSLEAVAFAAEQLQKAMEQATSDLGRDVSLGFATGPDATESLRKALGFGGLTDAQIRGEYTPYTGTQLTPEQEQLNNNIKTFLDFEAQNTPNAGAAAANDASSAGARASAAGGSTNALVNGAQALTEATGFRLADYAASELIEIRAIRRLIEQRGGSVFSGSLAGLQGLQPIAPTPLSNLVAPAVNFAQPPTPALDPAALAAWIGATRGTLPPLGASGSPVATAPAISTGDTVHFSITITQQPGQSPDALASDLVDKIEQLMAQRAANKLLRDGNPIKVGS